MAEDPLPAPVVAQTPASETLTQQLAALIRNGLSNGPIAHSAATWDHLNTRLPEIVAAIMKEL